MTFNLNDYKGEYVMRCKTKEEAESFCRFLHQNGKKWSSGDSYLEFSRWDLYKTDTVYYFNKGMYCDVAFAKWQCYTILEWSDFMENEEPGDRDIIYAREEAEMTLEEICKALGGLEYS